MEPVFHNHWKLKVQKELGGLSVLNRIMGTPRLQRKRSILNLHEAFELVTIATWNSSQLAKSKGIES